VYFSIYYVTEVKNTLPGRLERLFAELGVNQKDLVRKTGYGQPYISQILSGSRGNPSRRFYDNVCREYNINPEWLQSGKGGMFSVPGRAGGRSEEAKWLAKMRQLPKSEQRIIEDMIDALLNKGKGKK
jgi:transcriptional regulator with XRE-family HTH domain